jgi:ribosomal protein L5
MTDKKELQDLYKNFTQLEDENQNKLLQVGKKLLRIKKVVVNNDVPEDKRDGLKSNNEKLV